MSGDEAQQCDHHACVVSASIAAHEHRLRARIEGGPGCTPGGVQIVVPVGDQVVDCEFDTSLSSELTQFMVWTPATHANDGLDAQLDNVPKVHCGFGCAG